MTLAIFLLAIIIVIGLAALALLSLVAVGWMVLEVFRALVGDE